MLKTLNSTRVSENSPRRDEFFVINGGISQPLPSWAHALLYTGATFAQSRASDRRVLALVLPTRGFGAVFLGAGVVIGRSRQPITPEELSHHFADLCALPKGTPVTYTELDHVYKGLVEGYRSPGIPSMSSTAMIGVRTQFNKNGEGLVTWVPERLATRISRCERESLHLPMVQRGKSLRVDDAFLDAILQLPPHSSSTSLARLDCLLVGSMAQICDEVKSPALVYGAPDFTIASGTLQSLVRLKRFTIEGELFKSDVVPPGVQRALDPYSDKHKATIIVFDGALALIKSRHQWPDRDWIVVLDRTEPQFLEAVAILNELYMQQGRDEAGRLDELDESSLEYQHFMALG